MGAEQEWSLTQKTRGNRGRFVTELGPPNWYAITGPDGNELSDRWEDALLLKQHVRRIWERLGSTQSAP